MQNISFMQIVLNWRQIYRSVLDNKNVYHLLKNLIYLILNVKFKEID